MNWCQGVFFGGLASWSLLDDVVIATEQGQLGKKLAVAIFEAFDAAGAKLSLYPR